MGLQLIIGQTNQIPRCAISRAVQQRPLCVTYLDDFVLWLEAGSLCRRVFIHGADELARLGLIAVKVEAVAVGSFPQVAETRPRASGLLLQTRAETEDTGVFYCRGSKNGLDYITVLLHKY